MQIATYRDASGTPVAQKVRFRDKRFEILGDAKAMGLYGRWLWREGGKKVVIVEGEIDALSMSQAQGNRWPVLSVPNGAQSAAKALSKELDYLEGFEEVVLMFDNDAEGKAATEKCSQLFSPGKCKVASLPLKDANDMLRAGRTEELVRAMWEARPYRPDGIIDAASLAQTLTVSQDTTAIPYPWQGLNTLTLGMRRGELVTVGAGSGIGKSSLCRELAYHLLQQGETVGYLGLEENTRRTALGIVGLAMGRPLHVSREGLTDDALQAAAREALPPERFYLYDHFGSTEPGNILSRIRYMARGLGCGWVFLDHLSVLISGLDDPDERRLIDQTMTKLRCLVEETKIGLILVSHLRRPEGKGHEEGAQVSLAQFRGSHAIAQLSDVVLGMERDQQDIERKDETTIRVLKNRFTGDTGPAGTLRYHKDTGRLTETAAEDLFT